MVLTEGMKDSFLQHPHEARKLFDEDHAFTSFSASPAIAV